MAIQIILNQQKGPLPLKVQFNAPTDGPANLMICGSVWTQNANQVIGFTVTLDGTVVGSASIFSNLQGTHRAVVPTYIPVNLAFGAHTLELSAENGYTVSDFNDFFTAVLNY